MHAVEHFDPDKGVPFLTYVRRIMENAIIDAIREAYPYTKEQSESNETIADMMHSPYELNPEYILLRKELLNALHNAIESLTRREKVWIDRRYGFEDGEPHHLTEMAREYQMTKSRAKNTENRALQKLKGQMKDYDRSCLHYCSIRAAQQMVAGF